MAKQFMPPEDIAGMIMHFDITTCQLFVYYGGKPELVEACHLHDFFKELGITIWDCYRALAKHEDIRGKIKEDG
jgi:hypothetical protein